MVYVGCTVSPPIVSIFIRSGWVMVGLKDNYLDSESSGDQYAGRHISELDQLEKRLLLHPHTLIYLQLRARFKKIQAKERIK